MTRELDITTHGLGSIMHETGAPRLWFSVDVHRGPKSAQGRRVRIGLTRDEVRLLMRQFERLAGPGTDDKWPETPDAMWKPPTEPTSDAPVLLTPDAIASAMMPQPGDEFDGVWGGGLRRGRFVDPETVVTGAAGSFAYVQMAPDLEQRTAVCEIPLDYLKPAGPARWTT